MRIHIKNLEDPESSEQHQKEKKRILEVNTQRNLVLIHLKQLEVCTVSVVLKPY